MSFISYHGDVHICTDSCKMLPLPVHEQINMLDERLNLLQDLHYEIQTESDRLWRLGKDVDVWIDGYINAIQTVITNAQRRA